MSYFFLLHCLPAISFCSLLLTVPGALVLVQYDTVSFGKNIRGNMNIVISVPADKLWW